MDRHQAQGARRGRLQALDLPGVRDRLRDLQKILRHPEPPGYRLALPRAKTKLGSYLPVIEGILLAERDAPPKQRHTAKRIFERLRDEHGYGGGITQVKEAVARYRRHHAEVFVPLSHPPGEAQFDFGFATVKIAGVERKAACAVMGLPYSDAFLVQAYPRECTETFHGRAVARGTNFAMTQNLEWSSIPVMTDSWVPSARRTPPMTSICHSSMARERSHRR